MRFITPTLHGVLDYSAALALTFAPFVLGLDEQSLVAHWLSVGEGIGLIVYSLMTDYRFSLARIFSFQAHLALDLATAGAFLLSPWLFGFGGLPMVYCLVMGAAVIVVVAFSHSGTPAINRLEENT